MAGRPSKIPGTGSALPRPTGIPSISRASSNLSTTATQPSGDMDEWDNGTYRYSEAYHRGSDGGVTLTEDTDSFIIGDVVFVNGSKRGKIAFIGETQFAKGEWAGVVLDEPLGKNDGTVSGIRYFQCDPMHGTFTRLTRLTRGSNNPYGDECGLHGATPPRCLVERQRSPSPFHSKSPSPGFATPTRLGSPSPALKIGERVIVQSSTGTKRGILKFLGTTEFAAGDWAGIELDQPVGKNDGSVGGQRYFTCRDRYGLFAPSHKVTSSPANRLPSSGLRRQGSRESMVSNLSSITSSTAAFRAVRKSTSTPSQQRASTHCLPSCSLQEVLKEKEKHLEQLMREREMDRNETATANRRYDVCFNELQAIKTEYLKHKEESAGDILNYKNEFSNLIQTRDALKNALEEEKKKHEDILFDYEEDKIQLQSQIESLSNSNVALDEKLKMIRLANQNKPTISPEVEGQIREMEDNFTTQLNRKVEEARGLNEKLMSLDRKVEEANKDKASLSAQLSIKEEDLRNLALKMETDVVNVRKEADQKDLLIRVNEEKINQLISEVEKKENELSNFKANAEEGAKMRIQELEQKLSTQAEKKMEEISELNGKLLEFDRKLEEANKEKLTFVTQSSENVEKLRELTIRLEKEERRFQSMIKENETLAQSNLKKFKNLYDTIKEKEDALEAFKKKCDNSSKMEIRAIEESHSIDLKRKNDEIESLVKKMTTMKQKAEEVKKENEAFVQSSQTSIEEKFTQDLKIKEEEVKGLNEKLMNLDRKVEEVNNEKGALSVQLASKEEDLRNLTLKLESDNLSFGKQTDQKESLIRAKEEKINHLISEVQRKEIELSNFKTNAEEGAKMQIQVLEQKLASQDEKKMVEISALNDKLLDLDRKLEEANKEKLTFVAKANENEEKLQALTIELEKEGKRFQSAIEEKESSARSNTDKIKTLNDTIKQKEDEVEALKKNYDNVYKMEIQTLQESHSIDLKKKNDEFESLVKKMTTMEQKADEAKKENEALANRSQTAEEQLNLLTVKLEEESAKVEKLVKENAFIKHLNEEMNEKNERISADHERLRKQMESFLMSSADSSNAFEDLKQKLKSELKNKEEEIQVLNGKLSKIEEGVGALKLEKDSLASVSYGHEKMIHELKEKLDGEMEKFKKLTEEKDYLVKSYDAKIGQLDAIVVSKEKELAVCLVNSEEGAKMRIQDLEKEQVSKLELKDQELIASNEKRAKLEKLFEEGKKEKEGISEQFGELRRKLDEETKRFEKALEDKNALIRFKDDKMKDLTAKLDKKSLEVATTQEPKTDKDATIGFLNSIIVDLQKDKSELELKVSTLMNDMTLPSSRPGPSQSQPTPRVYCDICEMFDTHDTEDCPTQSQYDDDENSIKNKPNNEPRSYCETCEVFGHDTADCDEGETF